jgi:hypothetical protein
MAATKQPVAAWSRLWRTPTKSLFMADQAQPETSVGTADSEKVGCPISAPSLASCVSPEPRPLPSTGITRLHRYYEPLRHPRAPGPSLTGVRLIFLTTPWGFPCCVRFPCVHAVATTPAQRLAASSARFPSRISFPRFGIRVSLCIDIFEACSAFTRVTACTLAPSPYFVTASPKTSTVSLPPQLLRLLPAAALAGWGFHPLVRIPVMKGRRSG